jgi:hypothetical protein
VLWGWQCRLAVEEAEAEQIRRAEAQRLAREQAEKDYRLAQQVGQGGLSIAALTLGGLVGADGNLQREVQPWDVPGLVRASLDCLAFAHTGSAEGTDPNGGLHKLLGHVDESTRCRVLAGLDALRRWQEEHGGRR